MDVLLWLIDESCRQNGAASHGSAGVKVAVTLVLRVGAAPAIHLHKVERREVEWQKVEWPKAERHKVEWQKVERQKVEWQKVEWPNIERQKVEKYRTPNDRMPNRTKRRKWPEFLHNNKFFKSRTGAKKWFRTIKM
jgi:hypothetical protein